MTTLSEYQNAVLSNIRGSFAAGSSAVSIHAPPGWGRTLPQMELVREWIDQGHRVAWLFRNAEEMAHATNLILSPEGIDYVVIERCGEIPDAMVVCFSEVPAAGWAALGYDRSDLLITDMTLSAISTETRAAMAGWPGRTVSFSSAASV